MSIASIRWPREQESRRTGYSALAIAHEIGHVLINSNTHASSGLMRADWARHQLRAKGAAAWHFLDTDAEKVRAAALERLSER